MRTWAAWVLLLTCGAASAQEGHTKVLLHKDRLAAEWDTVNCVKNVLKLNPLLFLRGEVPLYYERALSHRVSVELAAGLTGRSYIGGLGDDPPDPYSSGMRMRHRPSAHAGIRWYLTDDLEPQGLYMHGEFAYLEHVKDITLRDSAGQFTGESLTDRRVYNDLRLFIGYQRLSSTSNWLWDAYCGAGFRNRAIHHVEEHVDTVDRHWSYEVTETHDGVPVLFLGVKVGYGF